MTGACSPSTKSSNELRFFSTSLGPLAQVTPQGAELVVLESGGTVRIIDPRTGNQRFTGWYPGLIRLSAVSGNLIIGARSVPEPGDGSLLSIDTITGETVALAGINSFTFDLVFDPRRDVLYSIGIDSSGNTNLCANRGKGMEAQSLIASSKGGDLSAGLAIDPLNGTLFSSLGFQDVKAWNGLTLSAPPTDFEAGDVIPRRPAARGDLLGSLNSDSSVTLWSMVSGKAIGTLYLFTNKEWCLIYPNGTFTASAGGSAMIDILSGGSPVEDVEHYRLRSTRP